MIFLSKIPVPMATLPVADRNQDIKIEPAAQVPQDAFLKMLRERKASAGAFQQRRRKELLFWITVFGEMTNCRAASFTTKAMKETIQEKRQALMLRGLDSRCSLPRT